MTFAALVLASTPKDAGGSMESSREYEVKAAFMFNFGQFVSWPSDAFPDAAAPFVIGVLGDDPFGATLDEMVRGERIANRRTVVERYLDVHEIRSCHILFVSSSETPRLGEILEALAGRSILTVGEAPGFADHAGIIRFLVVGNKLRLEVNPVAAESARLTISSKLLRVADVVRREER